MAEAHFNLEVYYLRLGEFDKMFEHSLQRLRIKLDIGKVSGVAAGLYSVGVGCLLNGLNPLEAGALLLTSEQIRLEVGEVTESYPKEIEVCIRELLKDKSNIERQREALAAISHKLPPFYQRAIERRCDNMPPLV